MIDKGLRVPLSPPESPRMSYSASTAEHPSQHEARSHPLPEYRSYPKHSNVLYGDREDVTVYPRDRFDPSLRAHKSFPHSLKPSGGSCHQYSTNTYSDNAFNDYQQPKLSQGLRSMRSSDFHSTRHGVNTPASPVNPSNPHSPDISVQDQQDDDDLIDSAGEDHDEGSGKSQMTAAELRAHKRKMKRFRLTHSQTRFLMSEFARQAHPDAGHRERLAREIPGLSARQVQVWFQNRRAKLKRHTTDDQARMMRSRALPDDFDTTQALHSPFGVTQPGPPISSMGTYPIYAETGGARPLTVDTLRGAAEYNQYASSYGSSTGMSPALGAFAFTPPQSATEHISPGNSSSMSPYIMQHRSGYENPRRGPISLPALEHGYAPMHHLQMSRTSGEPTSAPLRSSVSLSGGSLTNQQPHTIPGRSSSFSGHAPYDQHSRSARSVGMSEADTYNPALSYAPMTYSSNESQQQAMGGHQTNDLDSFRRAPVPSPYSQYPSPSYTSAPFQSYASSYASRDVHQGYSQEMQTEASNQAQRIQKQPYGMSGEHRSLMYDTANRITENPSGAHAMPPSY